MNKKQVEKITGTIKYYPTGKLVRISEALKELEDARELTGRMYHWHDFGNCSKRSSFKRRYDVDIDITVSCNLLVSYYRRVNPSRSYAYATDGLWAVLDGEKIKFTVADAKKIAAAIDTILERRASGKPEE